MERDAGGGWVELKAKNVLHKSNITRGSFRDGSIEPNEHYDYRIVITRDVEVEGVRTFTNDIDPYLSAPVHVFNYVPTYPFDFEATGNNFGVDLLWSGDCQAPYYTARWEGMGQPYTSDNNSVVIKGVQIEDTFCSQRYRIDPADFTLAEFTFYKFMISPCPIVSFAPGALACDYARHFTYTWTTTDIWHDRAQ